MFYCSDPLPCSIPCVRTQRSPPLRVYRLFSVDPDSGATPEGAFTPNSSVLPPRCAGCSSHTCPRIETTEIEIGKPSEDQEARQYRATAAPNSLQPRVYGRKISPYVIFGRCIGAPLDRKDEEPRVASRVEGENPRSYVVHCFSFERAPVLAVVLLNSPALEDHALSADLSGVETPMCAGTSGCWKRRARSLAKVHDTLERKRKEDHTHRLSRCPLPRIPRAWGP